MYKIRRLDRGEIHLLIDFYSYSSGLSILEDRVKEKGIIGAFSEEITLNMFNVPINIEPERELKVVLSSRNALCEIFIKRYYEFKDVIPFVSEYNGEIVGAVYLVRPKINNEIALYESLHIHPKHRRRGLGSKLTKACLDYLEKERVKAVFLTSGGETTPAYRGIYLKFGFMDLTSIKGAWMGKFFGIDSPKKFIKEYYNTGEKEIFISDLSLGHYPGIQMLINSDTATLIKNYSLGIFKGVISKGLIVRNLLGKNANGIIAKTIISDRKVVGFVTLSPLFNRITGLFRREQPFAPEEAHIRLLDIYLSPYHWKKEIIVYILDRVKETCRAEGVEKVYLYIGQFPTERCELFKKVGFTIESVLEDRLRTEGKKYNIFLMSKSF